VLYAHQREKGKAGPYLAALGLPPLTRPQDR
jgi:hypothetical protein